MLMANTEACKKFQAIARPGNIFKDFIYQKFGTPLTVDGKLLSHEQKIIYRCIGNYPADVSATFEPGTTCVGVGMVDNSELLFGTLKEGSEPLKYVGIDMNPICVARSLLIYSMMKQK